MFVDSAMTSQAHPRGTYKSERVIRPHVCPSAWRKDFRPSFLHRYCYARVNDLQQSRRLEKGGTAQSGSFVSRLQAAPLTTGPCGPIVDLPPLVYGCTLGSSPHPCQLLRHSTPEPSNGAP